MNGERISRRENYGQVIPSPVVIEGQPFCSNLCFTEWRRRGERGEAT